MSETTTEDHPETSNQDTFFDALARKADAQGCSGYAPSHQTKKRALEFFFKKAVTTKISEIPTAAGASVSEGVCVAPENA